MSEQLGMLIADIVKREMDREREKIVASIATYGVAASAPGADPDGGGWQVIDVREGTVTWPGLAVRSGETIANGDTVLILKMGQAHTSGWLVLKA